MNAEEFTKAWNLAFPGVSPEPQLLSLRRPSFRIHSLPASKQYADNAEEWDVLLSRHNQIFNDLFGDGGTVYLVTGEYHHPVAIEVHPISSVEIAQQFELTSLAPVDLHSLSDTYDNGQVYRPMVAELVWKSNAWNDLLRAFAENELKGFMVSFDREIIVAPYDGGIDLCFKNEAAREHYNKLYPDWISPRPDGL